MTSTLTIGKRLVPLEQIALLEPFDLNSQSKIKSDKSFQTRIVLLNRDSLLSEDALEDLTVQCKFRAAKEDGIAFNPSILFSVEAFEASGDFKPTKEYRSRLIWRDQTGFAQSKLLLISPEEAVATIVRGDDVPVNEKPRKARTTSRRPRTKATAPAPA